MTEALAERTIEEDVAAALAEHTAPAQTDATPVPETPDAAPSGPARGPDGKFLPRDAADTEPKADETPADPAAAPETKADTEPKPDDADQPAIPDRYGIAPRYAKKAIRENWASLPDEVRRELHERETEFHKQLTAQDDERSFGREVKKVVAPYENFIQSLGANPIQAFDYLIKTDYALRTAPPEQRRAMFIQAAKDYGINLDGIAPTDAAPSDPRVETLAQRLERLEAERQSEVRSRQLQEQQALERQLEDFASRPENVFFDRVSPMMATLLQSGQADSLEKAYEMAVYADPETRALQLAAQGQHSQRSQTSSAAAQRARAASVSVTGAPGPAEPASSPSSAGSLEDDIRAAIAAASGRI